MTPGQLLIVVIACLVTGSIGYLVGRPTGGGWAGFWWGFLLSVIGVVIVALATAMSPQARKDETVRREAERLRVRHAAQARLDTERSGEHQLEGAEGPNHTR